MTEQLPPEVRVKVAEECAPEAFIWDPVKFIWHKDALTRTAARLIRDTPSDEGDRSDTWRLFGESVADDDVNALERIVAELLGFL